MLIMVMPPLPAEICMRGQENEAVAFSPGFLARVFGGIRNLLVRRRRLFEDLDFVDAADDVSSFLDAGVAVTCTSTRMLFPRQFN